MSDSQRVDIQEVKEKINFLTEEKKMKVSTLSRMTGIGYHRLRNMKHKDLKYAYKIELDSINKVVEQMKYKGDGNDQALGKYARQLEDLKKQNKELQIEIKETLKTATKKESAEIKRLQKEIEYWKKKAEENSQRKLFVKKNKTICLCL